MKADDRTHEFVPLVLTHEVVFLIVEVLRHAGLIAEEQETAISTGADFDMDRVREQHEALRIVYARLKAAQGVPKRDARLPGLRQLVVRL